MKTSLLRHICFLILTMSFAFLMAQESKIMVQSAHAGHISFAKIDSVQNLLVTYGSFDDKSIKFWDLDNGTMLKAIDNDLSISNIVIDASNGLTYISTKEGIRAISNNTFENVKEYPISFLKNFVYYPKYNKIYYVSGTAEFEGVNSFYELNPNTGKSIEYKSKWPSQGYPMKANLVGENNFIEFRTNYMEKIYYNPDSGEFGSLNSEHLAVFSNYDLLYANVVDDEHIRVLRYNIESQSIVWEQNLNVKETRLINRTANVHAALTPDESGIWVMVSKSDIFELDAKTGEVKGTIPSNKNKTKLIADNDFVYVLERTTNSLKASGYFRKFRRYSDNPLATYGYAIFNGSNFETFQTETENGFVFNDLMGNIGSFMVNQQGVELYNYNTNYKQNMSLGGGFKIDDANKKAYYVMGDKEGIKSFTIGKPLSFGQYFESEAYNSINIDTKQDIVVTRNENSFVVTNVSDQSEVSIPINNVNTIVNFNAIVHGDYVGIIINDEVVFDQTYKKRIDYYNYKSKTLIWQKEGEYGNLLHLENRDQLITLNISESQVEVLDAKTGNLVNAFKVPDLSYGEYIELSPSESLLIVSGYRRDLQIFDISSGEKISSTSQFDENYAFAKFFSENIYALLIDGHYRFYSIQSHEELFRLYIFLDGEWLAHAPNGQFEGSQKAWSRVIFTKGSEVIPLNQVFSKFYTPNLISGLIEDASNLNTGLDISQLNQVPEISMQPSGASRDFRTEDDSIEVQDATFSIELSAEAFNDEIKEIRIYQNGKRILADSKIRDSKMEVDIELIDGDNTIEAVAVNSQDTESAPRTLRVRRRKKAQTDSKNINLHLVTIGIDKYKNPKYNLNYAVADASGFESSVTKGIKDLVIKTNSYNIQDNEAVKQRIIETMNAISKNAKPEDILIFYYAGHGVMSEGEQKEFYIIPHDLTQLYGNDDALNNKGISATELKSLSGNIAAQKQLFILDACQSGGALQNLVARGAAEERAIAQLARSTGTHWLTASGSEQFATEFADLGHGAFTYALLEALAGKADSGDSRITVNEIKAYLESRVPELSEQYKGTPQYPSSFGFGQDFPVSIKQ
ncbi:caspase family protein [Winogradskyella tangerina]|uniref:caspase family protein n=1 Tax=Winogradskyella tangerina TaxID=2023240 RepID=UPI000DBE0FF7|nr:caspase family protein [Winogradskyella tangerina]